MILTEQMHRAPLALLSVLLSGWLAFVYRADRRAWGSALVAALIVALAGGIYWAQGRVYSLSELTTLRQWAEQIAWRLAVAVAIGGLVAWAALRRASERSPTAWGARCARLALQTWVLTAIPLAACFTIVGFGVNRFVPDPTTLYVQLYTLLQLTLLAPLLIALVWLTLLLRAAVQASSRLRRRIAHHRRAR